MSANSKTVEVNQAAVPSALQQRCLLPGDGSQAAMDAISNAEQALEKLSVNFDAWMGKETSRLKKARADAKASQFSTETLDELFSASHDLKGQAGTLGYHFAADICASLCRLISADSGGIPLPVTLIDQHVDAVSAIYREQAKGDDHPKASVLARKLFDITDDYLIQLHKLTTR